MLEQIVQRTAVVFHEEVNSLPDLASSFQVVVFLAIFGLLFPDKRAVVYHEKVHF